MKAILLAGGKGTRLRPLTVHTPKPIVPIFNRPFLYYQIDLLRQVPEIDEVDPQPELPAAPDRGDLRRRRRARASRIRYVVEPMPLGTGGAIRYAGDSLTESVVVFNGDVLTQVDLGAVLALHRERKAKATIVLTPVDNPRAYGLVETDAQGNIQRFLEKPGEDEITCNTINAGIYVLEPETFDRIPKDTAWSIERSYFPSLIERGETFVAYVAQRLLDRHRDAGEVPAGPPRHHGRPLLGAAVRRHAARGVGLAGRQGRGRRRAAGPVLRRRGGRSSRRARAILPYSVHRPPDARRRRRRSSTAPSSGRTAGSAARRSCAAPSSAATATSAATPPSRTPAVLGDKTVITDYSRL